MLSTQWVSFAFMCLPLVGKRSRRFLVLLKTGASVPDHPSPAISRCPEGPAGALEFGTEISDHLSSALQVRPQPPARGPKDHVMHTLCSVLGCSLALPGVEQPTGPYPGPRLPVLIQSPQVGTQPLFFVCLCSRVTSAAPLSYSGETEVHGVQGLAQGRAEPGALRFCSCCPTTGQSLLC